MISTKKKSVLVLGGCGFIGQNLILRLIKEDIDVYVYDKELCERLRKYARVGKVNFIKGDFLAEGNFKRLVTRIDYIVHLIHTTIPCTSDSDYIYDLESNLIPSIKLFSSSVNSKVKRIIFISSGGTVYGNSISKVPISEDSPCNPICSYGIVKLTIENYLKKITSGSDTRYTILRPSNPYGINYYKTIPLGLINVSLLKLLNNDVLEIWGNGESVRDYIYVEDLIDAIFRSLFPADSNYILNIGTGTGMTILEIVGIIQKVTSKKLKTRFQKNRKFDVNYNVLDINRSAKILDWKPKIEVEQGISITWNWLCNL